MVNKVQALENIRQQFPDRTIAFAAEQGDLYLFRAIEPIESDESGFDDLFSVSKINGIVKAFSMFDVEEL